MNTTAKQILNQTERGTDSKKTYTLEIRFPLPLPTWNRLLAMHPMEKKKLRDMTDYAISQCVQDAIASQTQGDVPQNTWLTPSFQQAYLKMIRPSLSRNQSSNGKKRSPRRNRKKRSSR